MQTNPGKLLVQLQHTANGKWAVQQVGAEDAMASFEDIDACVDYACHLERDEHAIVVQQLN